MIHRLQALRIVGIYAGSSFLWIVLSDRMVSTFVSDPLALNIAQTVKGWCFVAVTTAILYWLIDRALRVQGRMQSQLTTSRERYRHLFECMVDAVLVYPLDAQGRPGRFIDVNQSAIDRLGYSRDELLCLSPPDVIPHDWHDTYRSVLAVLRRDGRVVTEAVMKTKDGRRIPLEVAARLVLWEETPTIIAITRDITDRKESMARLVRSERLAAVGVLINGLAHEFNNLHTVILGEAELAAATADVDQVRQRLAVIAATAERATGITRNLLTLGRHDAPARQSVRLSSLIDQTLTILQGQLASEGIEVEALHHDQAHAWCDPHQIGQVVMNLLINGWHAMRGAPLRRLHITTGCENGDTYIRISDTGCGLSDDAQANIFIPFFTTKGAQAVAGSGQGDIKGTGLGLSLCKAIVDDHGGDIAVEATSSTGTTFRVRLPGAMPPAEAPAAAPPQHDEPAARRARILVVDDECTIRSLISDTLGGDHDVMTVDDGEAALLLLASDQFDLVLVDQQMPRMDGKTLIRRLRSEIIDPPPILLMSGRRIDRAELAVDGVLPKPFTLDDLRGRIASVMRQG